MYIYIIIIFILFIYGAFSTIFHSTDMVGNIGKIFGDTNLNLFGLLAYVDLLILLYPLYRIYRNENLFQKSDFLIGWILFFISLIILQSLLFQFNHSGSVGTTLQLFLLPYIGKSGMWLLWLLSFLVALVLLYDEIPELRFIYRKIIDGKNLIIDNLKVFLSSPNNPFFDEHSTEVMTSIVSKDKRVEQKIKSIEKELLQRAKKIIKDNEVEN